MSRVDQAEEAVKFMEDHIHEERLDKILWAARMRRDQAALQVPEWEELRDLAPQIKELNVVIVFGSGDDRGCLYTVYLQCRFSETEYRK
jgi:hypothetical protein